MKSTKALITLLKSKSHPVSSDNPTHADRGPARRRGRGLSTAAPAGRRPDGAPLYYPSFLSTSARLLQYYRSVYFFPAQTRQISTTWVSRDVRMDCPGNGWVGKWQLAMVSPVITSDFHANESWWCWGLYFSSYNGGFAGDWCWVILALY